MLGAKGTGIEIISFLDKIAPSQGHLCTCEFMSEFKSARINKTYSLNNICFQKNAVFHVPYPYMISIGRHTTLSKALHSKY